MSLLVKGGTVVTSSGERRADVRVVDGLIERVESDIAPAREDEVHDVEGLYVMPGFIDPHVHARDPGLTAKEDFGHLTRAAAAAGITTVLVMPNATPPVLDPDSFEDRARHHEASAHVDFGLWGLVLGRETATDLVALRDAGIVAAKLFWGYAFDRKSLTLRYDTVDASDADVIPPATNGDVWNLLHAAEDAGVLIGVHCEDHSLLTEASAVRGPAAGLVDLMNVRPDEAESIAVAAVIEIARATRARAHILHTSTARSAVLVRRAQADGIPVSAETCPHYLTLDPERLDAAAASTKMYPPVRGASDREGLWEAVADGTLGTLSSDHAPHTSSDRALSFERQPAGIAGTQTLVPVLLDAFRQRGLPLSMLVERLSESTASLYGLAPRKGTLQPGADGDLAIVDLDRLWRIDPEGLYSKDRASPWNGVEGRGMAVAAFVRGRAVMLDGRPLSEPTGRLVRPSRA